jgi:hypothetical protein
MHNMAAPAAPGVIDIKHIFARAFVVLDPKEYRPSATTARRCPSLISSRWFSRLHHPQQGTKYDFWGIWTNRSP